MVCLETFVGCAAAVPNITESEPNEGYRDDDHRIGRVGSREMASCLVGRRKPFRAGTAYSVDCLRASAPPVVPFDRIVQCMGGCLHYWNKAWLTHVGDQAIAPPHRLWTPFSDQARFEQFRPIAIAHNISTQGCPLVLCGCGWLQAGFGMASWAQRAEEHGTLSDAAEAAQHKNWTLSALIITDRTSPPPDELHVLRRPHVRVYFAANPTVHPKVAGFPYLKIGDILGRELHEALHQAQPNKPRQQLLFCTCCSKRDQESGRVWKVRALERNGFVCERPMVRREYYRTLATSSFLFAPRGTGPAEEKWWEAAALGTIILTDENDHVKPMLTGLPTVMVRRGMWSSVTPATLEAARDSILRGPRSRYDHMKAFWPQWLYRLHHGVAELTTSAAAEELAPPILLGGDADAAASDETIVGRCVEPPGGLQTGRVVGHV